MQTEIDIKNLYSDSVKSLETYIMFRIAQRTVELTPELKAKNRAPINLSIGAPVQPPPKYAVDALINSLSETGISTYSNPKGEPFFREAVAERMQKRFGVELDPKTEVVSLIGSKEGLAQMFRCIINPGDAILIPDPGYASYQEQIKVVGGRAVPIPLTYENNFMPDIEEIAHGIDNIKAVVINYPNNPLGATATREYLEKIVEFCRNRNILLISDAAYADIYFGDQEPPASILEFEGAKDIAIEFHSLSKPYSMTGWRVGWACGNREAIDILCKLKATVDTGIFKGIQKAAAAVLTSEEGDKYIQESNKTFHKKQEILLKGLKELGWDIDNLLIPKATFYLWLPIPKKYSSAEEFCNQILEKSGIVVVPGSGFGQYGEGFFRISISPGEQALYEVIDRMKQDGFSFN